MFPAIKDPIFPELPAAFRKESTTLELIRSVFKYKVSVRNKFAKGKWGEVHFTQFVMGRQLARLRTAAGKFK